MAKPVFNLTIKRRNGQPITYTDYKGEERQGKTVKVGALFANKFGGYDLVLDKPITLDPKELFISVAKPFERDGEKKTGSNTDSGLDF